MAGRYKLGWAQIRGRRSSDGKREGGGKREGTTTHPIEGLAELGEAGKMVAGVEPKGGGGMALGAELRRGERRKGGGD
jgi:hypothetical protein